MNQESKNPRLARWALRLQGLDFTIKHRAGKVHDNADFLSIYISRVAGYDIITQEEKLTSLWTDADADFLNKYISREEGYDTRSQGDIHSTLRTNAPADFLDCLPSTRKLDECPCNSALSGGTLRHCRPFSHSENIEGTLLTRLSPRASRSQVKPIKNVLP